MQKVIIFSATVLSVIGFSTASALASGTAGTTATVGLETDGDVALTSTPNIDFDSHKISVDTATYGAKTVSQPVTVKNPGLVSGWTVSVERSDFSGDAGTLKGANLQLTNGVLSSNDGNQSGKPGMKAAIDLSHAKTAAIVMSAAKGDGLGEFSETFDPKNAWLVVPAGNPVGNYKADLTWTLANTPEA